MSAVRSHVTLLFCAVLHAFTHIYGSMLVPLYLLIGVEHASSMVSLYSLVYCVSSYGAGLLTDRFNRKFLLGIGLLGNATAIGLIGLTHNYGLLLLWSGLSGLSGTIFHPAAGALVPGHYPKQPGMAVGLLGIGSGVGFFIGPQYSGWRAAAARWTWGGFAIEQWQKPCIEMGIAGIVFGILFLLIARETPHETKAMVREPIGREKSIRLLVLGAILGCRDFAGVAGLSLAGIYLLRAHHFDTKDTGMILGFMMLLSVVVNPTLVWATAGARRLPALRIILICGGLVAATIPFFPARLALPVLCAFQTCQMGSYAISDSAMLERLSGSLRGRGYGLYFTVAGTMGSLGPRLMGSWTNSLGAGADSARGYILPFGVLGACMIVAALAGEILARLGPVVLNVEAITETMPGSVEVVG